MALQHWRLQVPTIIYVFFFVLSLLTSYAMVNKAGDVEKLQLDYTC